MRGKGLVPSLLLLLLTQSRTRVCVDVRFPQVVYEIEWDDTVFSCTKHWIDLGIDSEFIASNPDGVTWGCDTCELRNNCSLGDTYATCFEDLSYKCRTCSGYPPAHPECSGVGWGQTFPDVPRAMWFAFVTLSTVGYGDVSPTSWRGQLFVCFVIICGLIFLAMPLAIVGNTFSQVWDDRQVTRLQRHLGQLLAENGIVPHAFAAAFKELDTGGDGTVSIFEFETFCTSKRLQLAKEEIKDLWKALDTDGSGTLTLKVCA